MLNAGRLLLVLATMGTWKACVEATIPRTAAPVLIFMVRGKGWGLRRCREQRTEKKYVERGRDNRSAFLTLESRSVKGSSRPRVTSSQTATMIGQTLRDREKLRSPLFPRKLTVPDPVRVQQSSAIRERERRDRERGERERERERERELDYWQH